MFLISLSVLRSVFNRPTYIILAFFIAFAFLFFAVWMRNLSFLWFLITTGVFSLNKMFTVFTWTYSYFWLNFTPFGMVVIFTLAFLSGINIPLIIYYLKRQLRGAREVGVSVAGLATGVLGVGCASCGSVILSSLIGYSASSAFLGVLPLRGLEFGVLGAIMLFISIVILSNKIASPIACATPRKNYA